jgi:lysophospholipase L1-like esterase
LTDSLTRLKVLAGLALVGTPLYLLQGKRLRKNTPRLPEVSGPRHGLIKGEHPPLGLLAIGESPLAGVGLDSAEQTVIARLAIRLAEQSGRAARWSIVARGGVTVADTCAELLPQVPESEIDLVLIALGVNDCLQLTSARGWQAGLDELLDGLGKRCRPRLFVLAGVPPMQHFPALPQPLSGMLGLRARMLDAASAELASSRSDLIHVPMAFDGRSQELFCEDGFHPGAHGHRLWADQIAQVVAAMLEMG